MTKIKPTALPEASGNAQPAARERLRQGKFATTLHLPCFMPRKDGTSKA